MKLSGARCDSCPLQHCGKAVPGSLPIKPSNFAIVSDFPGAAEVLKGLPFVGQAGRELEAAAARSGLDKTWRESTLITNVIACKPPQRLRPAEMKRAIEACAPRLAIELAAWRGHTPSNPSILLSGKAALLSFGKTRVESWCGGVWQGAVPNVGYEGATIIPTFNPARVMFEPWLRGPFRIHFNRALRASRGRLSWSWPEMVVGQRDGWEAVRQGLERILARTAEGQLLGHDVETAGTKPSSTLKDYGLGVVDPTGPEASDLVVTFDWRYAPDGIRELARRTVLLSPKRVMQNGKFDAMINVVQASLDISILRGSGPEGLQPWDDTMHLHQIVAPLQPHDLGFIASTELPHPRHKSLFHADSEDEKWESDTRSLDRAMYNAKDVWVTARSFASLERRLQARPASVAAYSRLLDETKLAYQMTLSGIAIDLDARDRHRGPLRQRIASLTRAIRKSARAAGFRGSFKRSSRPKLAAVFGLLGVEASSKTETGQPKFDVIELTRISELPGPAADLAKDELACRKLEKLLQTYVEELHTYIDNDLDGRMHNSWTPGLVSGRWSASSPGIHQMPKKLRDMFVAGVGHILIGFDLGQIEPRCLAVLSGDESYQTACASGKLYETLAKTMFRHANISQVSPGERQMAKRTNLAVSYGAGVERLEAALKSDFPAFTKAQAEHLRRDFFRAFPGIKKFQSETLRRVTDEGAIIDPDTGLVYPQPDGADPAVCANQPIQVAATWIMRQIVAEIVGNLPAKAKIVIFLHDELVVECPEEMMESVAAIMRSAAIRQRLLRGKPIVPVADFRKGKAWGLMEPF